MLFFYGTGNTRVTTVPLPGLACAHCGTPEALSCTVFSRYVQLFWIPVFAIGKSSVTACRHCKQVLAAREMPPAYRAPVQAVQQQARTPLTSFALPLVAGGFVALVAVMSLVGAVLGPSKPAGTGQVVGASTAESATSPGADSAETTAAPDPHALDYEKEGARYRVDVPAAGAAPDLYCLVEVTDVTPDSVFYRMTQPLHRSHFNDSVSIALSDSVPPGMAKLSFTKTQWQQATAAQGPFQRLP